MPEAGVIPGAMQVLSAVPYFSELDEVVLRALTRASIERRYASDEIVFLEGEPCAGLYVVQEGWLKSYKLSLDGREQVIRFVGPGEAFNEVGVLAGTTNQVSVAVLEPATVWIVQRDVLLGLMDRYPPLSQGIAQSLARRVLYLLTLVEDLSLRTVEARLARLLLEQAKGGVLQRQHWTTQAQMAARLGTVLDVVNRALHKLADQGLIRVARRQIVILDQEGLQEVAGLDV
jgi:CRP/FNR family transcriptional regulator